MQVTATLPAARRTLAPLACRQTHGHEPRLAIQDIQLARPQRAQNLLRSSLRLLFASPRHQPACTPTGRGTLPAACRPNSKEP